MKKKIVLTLLLLSLSSMPVKADSGVLLKDYNLTNKMKVEKGTNFKIIEEEDDFYKVLHHKKTFTIPKELMLKNKIEIKTTRGKASEKEIATMGYLNKSINLKFPNDEVLTLERGTRVPVYDFANGKFKLKDDNGNEYSVSEETISFKKPDTLYPEVSENDSLRKAQELLIAGGLNRMGLKYVWGGTSPIYGFDCSGFTQYLYAQIGVRLPRTSREQARVGVMVQGKDMQIGDLMFFGKGNIVDHVAMYIGNGKMIHSSKMNDGVGINNIDMPYVKNNIMFVKRIID